MYNLPLSHEQWKKEFFNYHLNWKLKANMKDNILLLFSTISPISITILQPPPSQILFDIPSFWRKIPEIYAMNIITLGIDLALKLPNLIVSHFFSFYFSHQTTYYFTSKSELQPSMLQQLSIITILYFQITIFFSCNVSEWYLLMNKQHSIWW